MKNDGPSGLRLLAGYAAGALGILLGIASILWWTGEARWGGYAELTPEQAFADGTFGLELAPLKYILVASEVSPAAFESSWVRRFGFLRRNQDAARACESGAPANLPVGFSVSNRLPGNGTPVPLKFVGLSCAACHAAAIGNRTILGAGSQTADVIAFSDAFLNAVLDPQLDAEKILSAYDKHQCPGETEGFAGSINRWVEKFFINQWLKGARSQALDNATKYDLPYHGAQLGNPELIPTGPSRTRPFRSVVRNTLDFPDEKNFAYSKVPLAAMQAAKRWSQFDGSIGDPVVRSLIAVFTSGATLPALNDKQVSDNIVKAAAYTLQLGIDPPLPSLADAFPAIPRPAADVLEQGRTIYARECGRCHGHPEPSGGWSHPSAHADAPSITELKIIGTDPHRLTFRYADMLPAALAGTFPKPDVSSQLDAFRDEQHKAVERGDLPQAGWWQHASETLAQRAREFPAGHQRAFAAADIAKRDGYLNAPIPFTWLRAPYLHNGSVPTLRALLGLDERPSVFCRGDGGYDPVAVGVAAPPPGSQGCDRNMPFLFDTAEPGNSNKGHNYPPPGAVSRGELEALFAYVGTL